LPVGAQQVRLVVLDGTRARPKMLHRQPLLVIVALCGCSDVAPSRCDAAMRQPAVNAGSNLRRAA
jgi:hypothetical protein